MSVQNIKDIFYSALRDRIATINPGRTFVVRSTTRPAVLVQENELPSAAPVLDAFTLRWTTLAVDPVGLANLTCEIHYATAGSTGAGGMDRGRALTAMDLELRTALDAKQTSPELCFTESAGANACGNIFWTSPAFKPIEQQNERLERSATVEVFGYE